MNNSEIGKLKRNVFNMYSGQNVMFNKFEIMPVENMDMGDEIFALSKTIYLQLKPVSEISFPDVVSLIEMEHSTYDTFRVDNLLWNSKINVTNITYMNSIEGGGYFYNYTYSKSGYPIESSTLFLKNAKYYVYDFLRSKGYAVPYMNYSVETLVEMGIIKISQPSNLDVEITEGKIEPKEKSMLEHIKDMAKLISSQPKLRHQESDILPLLHLPDLQKMTEIEPLPNECLFGWSSSMYCSGNNQCDLCRSKIANQK